MPLSFENAMMGAYMKNKGGQNDDQFDEDGEEKADDDFDAETFMAIRQRVFSPSLHPLIFTRHVFLRLCEMFDNSLGQQTSRNYEIFNTFGSRIYLASVRRFESSNICTRVCNLETKYEVFIWNHLGHPAFRMEGDNGRCGHGAGVSVSFLDQYVLGRIAQEPNTCYLEYSILDNGHPGTTLLKIRGPRRECGCCGGLSIVDDLALYTDDGKFLGRITHRWSELGENFIKDDDTSFNSYGLAFPIEMSPNLKAVTLCCLILLDIQFCPSTKDWQQIKSNRGHSCYIIFMLSLILGITIFMAFYLVTRPEHNLLP